MTSYEIMKENSIPTDNFHFISKVHHSLCGPFGIEFIITRLHDLQLEWSPLQVHLVNREVKSNRSSKSQQFMMAMYEAMVHINIDIIGPLPTSEEKDMNVFLSL